MSVLGTVSDIQAKRTNAAAQLQRSPESRCVQPAELMPREAAGGAQSATNKI